MAFNIVTVVTSDDPTRTLEDAKRLKLSLDRERIFMSDGVLQTKFYVVTDLPRESFAEGFGVGKPKLIQFEREGDNDTLHDPSFYQRYIFDNHYFGSDDKVLFVDTNCVVRDLMQTVVYAGLPDKGDPRHCQYDLTDEQEKLIKDEDLSTLFLQKDWTGRCDTMFMPWFYAFNYGSMKDFAEGMFDDDKIKNYKTFMHFIEEEFDGFVLQQPPGLTGPYVIGDEDANEDINQAYIKECQPHFPEQWRGLGGDEDALFISYEHEYRDISRQCSILYLDRGEELTDPFTDRYAELWLL